MDEKLGMDVPGNKAYLIIWSVHVHIALLFSQVFGPLFPAPCRGQRSLLLSATTGHSTGPVTVHVPGWTTEDVQEEADAGGTMGSEIVRE